MTTAETKPPVKPRISAKLRRAIVERARGANIKLACYSAGMSESGFYATLERPRVKELLSKELAMVIEEGAWLRGAAKARGLEGARELLETSQSESIKVVSRSR